MRKTLRSVICAVMVLVMMLTMAPSYAFAEGNDEGIESSQADTAQETLESGEAETAEETDSETVAETTEKEQKTKEEQNTNEEDEKVKATETEVTNEIESQTQSDLVESSESIVGNQKDDAVDEDSEAIVEIVEDTKTETEKETITENKKETEEENNIPKTEFQYVDDCVTITANAPAEANLPQDAELRADYLEPGSDEYNNAVTAIEAQLSEQLRAEQGNTAVDYVLYDIYFVSASDDKRIEPEDGKVTVKMTLHDLQEATEDGKIINKDVVHLKNDGVAEIVTDYINTNGKGEVTSMGFTQSSFSIVGGAVTHSENNTEPADVSEKLNDFLTSAEFGEEGEGGTVIVQENGSYEIELAFKEQEYLQLKNDGTLVYTFPKGFVPAECSDQNIIFDVSDSNGNVYQVSGTYSVKGQNLSIRINTEDENYHFLTAAANVEFDMKLTMTISADAESDKIDFGGGVIKDVVVNTNHDLSVEKSGTYNKSEGKFEYTIRVVSTGKNSNVVITDNITGTLLTYNRDLTVESSLGTDAVSGSDVSTENGFTYTEAEMQHGEVLTLKYSADIDFSGLTDSNKFTVEQTGNSVTVNSDESDEEEDSYDFSNQIAYDKVSKRSTNVDSDEIDGQIVSWEIVLNPDCKVAVGGKTVSDMISEDSKKIMRYTGDGITVTKYDADGIKVGDPQKITWESLNVDTQTATEWNWTIPVDDNVPYKYVVTYNTVVDGSNLWETTGVSNGVKFDGDTASGSANVEPGNTWGVSKSHTSASSSSRTVDWVITVDVAAEGFETFEVKDTLPSTWVNNVLYLHRLVGDVEVTGLQEGESYDLTYDNDYE